MEERAIVAHVWAWRLDNEDNTGAKHLANRIGQPELLDRVPEDEDGSRRAMVTAASWALVP